MTSREALEELYELALFDSNCDPDDCKRCTAIKVCGSYQYYKTIKKDLEVLEIIRNHTPSIMRLNLCNTVTQYNKIYIDNNPLQKRVLTD